MFKYIYQLAPTCFHTHLLNHFSVYHKARSQLYKLPIPPLTDKRYDERIDMFRWPTEDSYTIQFPRSYTTGDLAQFKESFTDGKLKVDVVKGESKRYPTPGDSGIGGSLVSREQTTLVNEANGEGVAGGGGSNVAESTMAAMADRREMTMAL